MKKLLMFLFSTFIFLCLNFFACSKNDDVESKAETPKKQTADAAKIIVDKIKTPIEKARAVKKVEEDRLKNIAEQ